MLVTLHLCGPQGDALRQQLSRALEIVKDDNCCVINAMLNEGMDVADTVLDLGLIYQPAQGSEKHSDAQQFYGMSEMIARGTFSCGDAAAYESAVMQMKYGIPSTCIVVNQGRTNFHALYVTAGGIPVDPTENWLSYMGARAKIRSPRRLQVDGLEQVSVGPTCSIIPGTNRVECSEIEGYEDGCCIGPDGRWNCPSNPGVHGKVADVRRYNRKDGVRWALVGDDRIPAPVCGKGARR